MMRACIKVTVIVTARRLVSSCTADDPSSGYLGANLQASPDAGAGVAGANKSIKCINDNNSTN